MREARRKEREGGRERGRENKRERRRHEVGEACVLGGREIYQRQGTRAMWSHGVRREGGSES